MKAMLFAAGVGSRLGEITRDRPKCLVEVGGKTILERVIERLKAAGVGEIAINLHHHPAQIIEFMNSRQNFGLVIHYSHELKLLDTGGGLLLARSFFESEEFFLVHNSDVYCEFDLNELVEFQRRHSPVATLLVQRRQSKRYLVFDPDLCLIGRRNAEGEGALVRQVPVEELYAFSGIQAVSRRIFDFMGEPGTEFSIISTYLEAAQRGEQVRGLSIQDAYWIDVGTPERLKELDQRLSVA